MDPLPPSLDSAQARLARTALRWLIAAGPVAWLLAPGLLARDGIPGAPTAGVYPLLHQWWAVGASPVTRFPAASPVVKSSTLATLFHPLVAALGAVVTVKLVLLAGALATVVTAERTARRALGDGWAAVACAAAFAACPAVVAGVTSGDPDALQGWALLALPLATGPACLAVGVAVAVAAPTMLPPALLPVLLAASVRRGRARAWLLAGWCVAITLRTALGWPAAVVGTGGVTAWFTRVPALPEPEQVTDVYVGFVAVGLLTTALLAGRRVTQLQSELPASVGSPRGWVFVGLAALAGALFRSPLPPERFLQLVPFAAAVGGLGLVRFLAPAWVPAAAVWVATALVGEGWKGSAAPVPLLVAPLAAPAPVDRLVDGPVLDLPATRGAIRRGLWYQVLHGHPIAPDPDGLTTPEVAQAAATLSAGGCADIAALGFTNVVARREGVLRELGGLRACLGEPAWDDGSVALWTLGPKPPTVALPQRPGEQATVAPPQRPGE